MPDRGTRESSFTGLRASGGRLALTIPRFPMLRVNVAKSPLFDRTSRSGGSLACPHDGGTVKQFYRCEQCEAEGTVGEMDRAFDLDGERIVITKTEADSLKKLSDKTLSLTAMVNEEELDVELFESTDLVFPDTKRDAEGYKLLMGVLKADRLALVGTHCYAGATKHVVVRASELSGTLVLHTLKVAETLRTPNVKLVTDALAFIPEPTPEMLSDAATLLNMLPATFDASGVDDDYAIALREHLASKAQGIPERPIDSDDPEAGHETPLMDAIRASIASAQREREEV